MPHLCFEINGHVRIANNEYASVDFVGMDIAEVNNWFGKRLKCSRD